MKKNVEIKVPLIYAVCFGVLIYLLNLFFYPSILNQESFLHWDAEHYYWIKNNGYEGFRVAFFPLFPMLWKVTSLSVYGVVLFNALLFLFSFYFLARLFSLPPLHILLYLSIPSFFFFYLPYSESVFFASATILLAGLKSKKSSLVFLGLFFSTLSRPAFTVFIPALIIAELLSKEKDKKIVWRILLYILISTAGLLLVAIVQQHYTGQWFRFFEAQKGWGNYLQVPKFPLTSWAGDLIVRLDGASLLIGLTAGITVLLYIFKAGSMKEIKLPTEVIFSLCYLAGISMTVLLFRGGNLFSLNRFVFAVPFIIVAADFYLKQDFTFTNKQVLVVFFVVFIFWLSFGSYVHIQALLKYLLLSLYLILLISCKSGNKIFSKTSIILLILINMIFQLAFYTRFLNGGWVG
ncbi:MAG TPA: hypothetical protein VNY73_00055 [Bacteroidia bacterium]|nr:hypothetical protein [Bacteroidia bacterium]